MKYIELENLYFNLSYKLRNNLLEKNDVIIVFILNEISIKPVEDILCDLDEILNGYYMT